MENETRIRSERDELGRSVRPRVSSPVSHVSESGFSLIEAMMASSVFALTVTALAGALVFGAQASVAAGARSRAAELAIEGIEGVRNIRDQAFNELQYAQSGVSTAGGAWDFLGEGSSETVDEFTRTISFVDVCRDGSNEIATCPASYTDPHTKEVSVVVSWESRPGATSQVERTTYLTNWASAIWPQSDWSGGGGQPEWSDDTMYDSDDGNVDTSTPGEVKLLSNASGTVSFTDSNQTDFDQGSYSDTQWNSGQSAVDLTATGKTNGSGTFDSRIFDSGSVGTQWDQVSWSENLGPQGELRFEVGTSSVGNSFNTVNLNQSYLNPVVIPFYFESANTEPVTVRLNNITSSSFEMKLQTSSGANANPETVHYMVIEEGTYQLPDGRKIEAHRHTTSTIGYKHSWNSDLISYSNSYATAPIVFHQVQTNNDSNWIESWVRSDSSQSQPPTTTGFRMGLNGAEAVTTHGSETIGWVAVETGSGTLNGINYEFQQTSDSVRGHDNGCYTYAFLNAYTSNPLVIGDQQEMDGGNGGWAVGCSLSNTLIGMHVEEDQVTDAERSHITETYAYAAFEQAFSYRALDVTFQVRSCNDAACSGESFVGPDGTSGTYFTTAGGEALNVSDNRYVQYRGYFSTADSNYSPELSAITITGQGVAGNSIVDDTQAEFDVGTYSDTQYDASNSWLELTAAGQSAGSGTYSSQVFDVGTSASWDDLTWVPQRPTGKELPNNGVSSNWWDANYLHRKKVSFGTNHSSLPLYYTAAFAMDTRPSVTNVALTSGNDVRVVWQPTSGSPIELDRLGDTWDNVSTTIRFRLQSAIVANANTDTDGDYYVYYGNATAGTPPTNEMNVYYFADFFNRTNSSTIGNGWTEWNTGGGNVSIASNAAAVTGNNTGPADAGIKQSFPLGTIPGDFALDFDWTMPTNPEGIWTHYVNIGNSTNMVDSSRTTGVGPGIYNGEGGHFSPNGTENVSNNLAGNMENNVNGGPHMIHLVVNTGASTYDYYRDNSLIASGQSWVNSGTTLNQIRIATDQYIAGQPAFTYDNLRVFLTVATPPTVVAGSEQAQTAVVESGYATGNVDMSSNQLLLHLNESAGVTTFADSAGLGRNPTCAGTSCPSAGGAGQLGHAVTFDGTGDKLTTPVDLNQWLGGTASMSYWIKTTQIGNNTFWQAPGVTGVEQAGGGNDIFWGWLDASGHIGFQVGDGAGIQSANPVNDGAWHHILMTRNSTTGAIALYVDGAAQTTTSDTGTKTTSFSDIGVIGDTGGTPTYFQGSVDEFSVWSRVLSPTEASDIYRRGALNLKFQIRSCNDAVCSGETFVGPDGTAGTYYDELANATLNPPATTAITSLADNRYFQYQVSFATQNATVSPELHSLTVNYTQTGGGGYVLTGSLVSSAFDMGDASPVETIEWDATVPSCSPACTVKLQVRTAPDASGSPGAWTSWYGTSGSGTYFTDASRVSVDLNGNQWVQYRVELVGDGTDTPVVTETRLYYR